MTTCLGIRNATHWTDTRSTERISCYFNGMYTIGYSDKGLSWLNTIQCTMEPLR